jgi:hypothetical protein
MALNELRKESSAIKQWQKRNDNWFAISTIKKAYAAGQLEPDATLEDQIGHVLRNQNLPVVGETYSGVNWRGGAVPPRTVKLNSWMDAASRARLNYTVSDDPANDPEYDAFARKWQGSDNTSSRTTFVDVNGKAIYVKRPLKAVSNGSEAYDTSGFKNTSCEFQCPQMIMSRKVLIEKAELSQKVSFACTINSQPFLGLPKGGWLVTNVRVDPYTLNPPAGSRGYKPKKERFVVEYQITSAGPIDIMTLLSGTLIDGKGKRPWDGLSVFASSTDGLQPAVGERKTKHNEGDPNAHDPSRFAQEVIVEMYDERNFKFMGTEWNVIDPNETRINA